MRPFEAFFAVTGHAGIPSARLVARMFAGVDAPERTQSMRPDTSGLLAPTYVRPTCLKEALALEDEEPLREE